MDQVITKKIDATNRFSRQRGASLLEGIAYLGIAAIVILGAVSLLTGAFSSASSNQTAEELISLRTATKKMYAGQGYPNATNLLATLIPARVLPGTLVPNAANNTATNKWGGNVTVQGGGTTFTITYNTMPTEVCMATVSGASGWDSIGAVGAAATALNGATATAAQASAICNNAGAANVNVAFTST